MTWIRARPCEVEISSCRQLFNLLLPSCAQECAACQEVEGLALRAASAHAHVIAAADARQVICMIAVLTVYRGSLLEDSKHHIVHNFLQCFEDIAVLFELPSQEQLATLRWKLEQLRAAESLHLNRHEILQHLSSIAAKLEKQKQCGT
eukprot:4996563-Amphidinium_carterae.1